LRFSETLAGQFLRIDRQGREEALRAYDWPVNGLASSLLNGLLDWLVNKPDFPVSGESCCGKRLGMR
jgi:hypothetical protein